MPAALKYEEAELIALLKNREEVGFSYLYDNYSGALFQAISVVVTDKELAADVLQEVFVNIFKRIDTYDPTRSRLYTWMLNVARNAAIDMLRSKGFRQTQQNREVNEAVYESTGTTQIAIDQIGLRKMVGQLKTEVRHVVELAYFGGYTQEEISDMLQVPLGTVKTRVRSGLKQLRTLMQ